MVCRKTRGSGPSSRRWSCSTPRTHPGASISGLFLKRDLHAPDRMLAYAFVVSMVAWMLVVWPAGWLADRCGRKPLLIAGWTIMAVRLGLVSVVAVPELAVANQALDGLGNGLFAVMAAAWVTDRLADPRRSGEAQVIVGSCLVFGSAIGPAAAGFLVGPLGYRGLFAALAGARRGRDGDRRLLRPGDVGEARRTHRRPDRRPDGHDVRSLDRPLIRMTSHEAGHVFQLTLNSGGIIARDDASGLDSLGLDDLRPDLPGAWPSARSPACGSTGPGSPWSVRPPCSPAACSRCTTRPGPSITRRSSCSSA